MNDFLQEIQETFLLEAEEFIIQSKNIFLKIEKKKAEENDYRVVKRIFHILKGSAKAVGFNHITVFCHEIENLISVIPLENFNSESIQLLFTCHEQLKIEIENLSDDSTVFGNFDLNINLLKAATKEANALSPRSQSWNDQVNKLSMPIISELDMAVGELQDRKNYNVTSDLIEVPLKKIDEMLDLFGEQMTCISALDTLRMNTTSNQDIFEKAILDLKKLSYDLQQNAISFRTVGVRVLNSKLSRAVRIRS